MFHILTIVNLHLPQPVYLCEYMFSRFDFGWWAQNAIYRWCIIEFYIWNLHNFINQCHPNWFNLKKENGENSWKITQIQTVKRWVPSITLSSLTINKNFIYMEQQVSYYIFGLCNLWLTVSLGIFFRTLTTTLVCSGLVVFLKMSVK